VSTPDSAGTDTSDIDPCPHCDTTAGVRLISSPPKVWAWSCAACGTRWVMSVVNPHLYLDRLAEAVAEAGRLRWLLRQVVQLADDAPTITDEQLRIRLRALTPRTVR
jgi:ribosomal protein L37AE/L43A